MRIAEACAVFIRHRRSVRRLSEHMTRAYRLDLNRFTRFAGLRTHVASRDRSTLQRYVEHLFNDHQLKETSAKRHLASLRSLFAFLRMRITFPKIRFAAHAFGFHYRSAYRAS